MGKIRWLRAASFLCIITNLSCKGGTTKGPIGDIARHHFDCAIVIPSLCTVRMAQLLCALCTEYTNCMYVHTGRYRHAHWLVQRFYVEVVN